MNVCDYCGAAATTVALDLRETSEPGAEHEVLQAVGGRRYGCAEHPATAQVHRRDGTVGAFEVVE